MYQETKKQFKHAEWVMTKFHREKLKSGVEKPKISLFGMEEYNYRQNKNEAHEIKEHIWASE